jgi:hypothetical protein
VEVLNVEKLGRRFGEEIGGLQGLIGFPDSPSCLASSRTTVAAYITGISRTTLILVAVATDNTFGLSHTVIAGRRGLKVET